MTKVKVTDSEIIARINEKYEMPEKSYEFSSLIEKVWEELKNEKHGNENWKRFRTLRRGGFLKNKISADRVQKIMEKMVG